MASFSSAQSKRTKSLVEVIQTEHRDQQLSDRWTPVNNPFIATTPREREINFPPFDEALVIERGIVNSSTNSVSGQSSSLGGGTNCSGGDSSNNAHLSISARAALAEHNRYIARFGIDSSMEEEDHDVAFPQFVDPLDAEWERLLLNTTSSDVNLSHISPNHSVASAAAYPLTTEEQVLVATSRSRDGEDIDAIETVTEVSCSDFLNTSRAIEILRTPEHLHSRENNALSNDDGVTMRRGDIHSTANPWDSSEASFSDDSTRMLRKMYLNSMGSQLPQPSESTSSKSPSSRTRVDDQESFSLYNVDISRISADDDESITAKNLDHSFTTNSNIFPDPMNNFFSSNSQSRTLTPSISNSTSRKTIKQIHQPLSESNILTPQREIRWHSSPSARKPHANRPVVPGTHISEQRYPFEQEEMDDGRTIESRFATMALSPISKQAADKAISILQSSPDWNVAFSPTRNSDFTASTQDTKRPKQLMHDDLFLYPNILHSRSDDDTNPDEIMEVKYGSDEHDNDVNDDSKDQFFDYEVQTSPLHSSSEDKNDTDGRDKDQSTPPDAIAAAPEILENSGSSEDHLKKNSLSSISPNSSTEHHITTKPTANSSSSLSASTKNSSMQREQPQTSSANNNSQQAWEGFTDRRRYRTVVPIRVFISEPNLFPNEEDSFSSQPKQLSVSLPPYIGSSSKRVAFIHQPRSIQSSPR